MSGGQYRRRCSSADGCCRLLGRKTIDELQGFLGLRDLGHGGLGEEAPALQLPLLLLLQQLAANQPGDRGIIGDDADHVDAALDEEVVRAHLPVRR